MKPPKSLIPLNRRVRFKSHPPFYWTSDRLLEMIPERCVERVNGVDAYVVGIMVEWRHGDEVVYRSDADFESEPQ